MVHLLALHLMPASRRRHHRPPQRHLRPRNASAPPASPTPGFVHAPADGTGAPRLISAPRGALAVAAHVVVVVLVETDVPEVDAAPVLLGRAAQPPADTSAAAGSLGEEEEENFEIGAQMRVLYQMRVL